MTYHHSGCCYSVGKHVGTLDKHDKAIVSSLVVKFSFLERVCEATWDSQDAKMRKLAYRARGNHA